MVERKRTANFCSLLILHYHEARSTTHNKTDGQTDRQKTRMLKSHHSAACKTLQTNAVPEAKERKSCRKWRVQKRAHGHSYIHVGDSCAMPCAPPPNDLAQSRPTSPPVLQSRASSPSSRTRRRERERRRKTNSRVPIPAYPSNTQNPSSISRPKGNDWTSLDKSKLIQVPLWDPETSKRSRVQTQWCAGETPSLRALCLYELDSGDGGGGVAKALSGRVCCCDH
jgi:hypothetical protein